MRVFIAKIDYFDPNTWPALAAPYANHNPELSRRDILNVANELRQNGIALLVGSIANRTAKDHQAKLLGAVQCYQALYHTAKVVHPKHLECEHFRRRSKGREFRMPYCIPYSKLWACRQPLIFAEQACGDEIHGRKFPPQWFIRLSDRQAEIAFEVLQNEASLPVDLPRPDQGFIKDL